MLIDKNGSYFSHATGRPRKAGKDFSGYPCYSRNPRLSYHRQTCRGWNYEIHEKKKREPQMNTDKHGYSKGCKVIRHAIVPQAVRGHFFRRETEVNRGTHFVARRRAG